MDLEPEELQFLGLVGILATSSRLVSANPRHRRLFMQITAALILPLSVLFLAHALLSHLLFSRIHHDERALDLAPPASQTEHRLLRLLSSKWSLFLLFKSVYLLFLLVLSLLSVSAVVYSVASIFSSKDIHFRKVFTVLPKVWRRLMLTFLWAFLFLFAYHAVAFALALAVAAFFLFFLVHDLITIGILLILVSLLAYFAGLVWISVVWHVASVISVLEDLCGIGAMKKSRRLIQGKSWLACGVFLLLNLAFAGIEFGFGEVVVEGKGVGGVVGRIGFGVTMWVMLMVVILLGLVAQTVVYFVCKSHHHESIDKSSLADHLEVYLGGYVPLKERDVQMENYSSSNLAVV